MHALFITSTCRLPYAPKIHHASSGAVTRLPYVYLPWHCKSTPSSPCMQLVLFCFLVDMGVQSTNMQVQEKRWKKNVVGNKVFADVKNPLRNFVEKTLPSIDLAQYPTRPTACINLSIGDPTTSLSFRTHPQNLQSICKGAGKVDGYTNTQGLDGTRQAVVDKFAVPSFGTSKEDVFLCAGGSLAIWATMYLLAGEGDNFLFPSPGFPLALTIAKGMGLQPRFYHLQAGDKWSASVSEMEGLIDGRTRFIMVNDPSNPLGAAWSAEHKKEILQLSKRHRLPILADEIYEDMTYAERVPTFAQLVQPQDAEQIAIFKCSGLTKRYLGPGWRMGWIILYASQTLCEAYRPLLRGIFNVILMPNTVMQVAVPSILANPINEKRLQQCMGLMRVNQQTLRQGLEGKEYCSFGYAAGALYATVLLDMSKFGPQVGTTADFCKLLYAEQNVKVFPGEFFAGEVAFLRLVISCQHDLIVTFLERFHAFCQAHLLPK